MTLSLTAPDLITGRITLPRSKSISNRLLLLGALAGSHELPDGLSDSDDTKAMIDALQGDLAHVDVGAAGTAMRFLTAYLATRPGQHTITGSERMRQRPIGPLVQALRQLGAAIDYLGQDGCPPLRIDGGNIAGGQVSIEANVSSQYISALMMIGPTLRGGLHLTLVGELSSLPYINMTARLMEQWGAKLTVTANTIAVQEGPLRPTATTVESDWSAAAYWYALCALAPGSRVELPGLRKKSLQGDQAIYQILQPLGVNTDFTPDGAVVTSTGNLAERIDINLANQPDLAQTIAVCCCLAEVQYDLEGLHSLPLKETNRLQAVVNELATLGFHVETNGRDNLVYNGVHCVPRPDDIRTYDDHRMALAFAAAAWRRKGLRIQHPEVVAKSYPTFWRDLASVGFALREVQ